MGKFTMKSCAIAVFVKTPGLSPIKARLAESIGKPSAEKFYQLSCHALAGVIRKVGAELAPQVTVEPFWAVAEPSGLKNPTWKDFSKVAQGEGALGDRFSRVYNELQKSHQWVIFVSPESPHTMPEVLKDAIQSFSQGDRFVFGASEDGGFFLFGGNRELEKNIWTSLPYSDFEMADVFAKKLASISQVKNFPALFNVDTSDDLVRLRKFLGSKKDLLPEQKALQDWLKANQF
jgi:glycosyltransferase A (GT-A) superfamily protein (DUF2064 family)